MNIPTSINNLSSACENTYFPTQLAIELNSTELAIVVQFFVNVITKHKRAGRNLIDGHTWNYCAIEELSEYFPFWSLKMIRTRIEKLIKIGILKSGNHNQKQYDRTLWYAFVDEKKWGLDKVLSHLPNRENAFDQMGKPIPSTKHRAILATQVNDAAPPSMTRKQKALSLFRSADKSRGLSDDQLQTLEWLRGLGIDTSDDTLCWWARKYTMPRLDEVYRETAKRKHKNLGAYMQALLKRESIVSEGRSKYNREYCTNFRDLNEWSGLEIFEKYAKFKLDGSSVEISFDMESETFGRYLEEKFNNTGS